MPAYQKRAILVDVIPHHTDRTVALQQFHELARLVTTYGGVVIIKMVQKRGRPSGKTYLGTGKAEEVAHLAVEHCADVVIVNNFLKPTQANNLRDIFEQHAKRRWQNHRFEDQYVRYMHGKFREQPCEIWDRFDIIIKIFEKHAQTDEAKLQVELARLKYELPRQRGAGGEQLSRLGKGKGSGSRGPGEQATELWKRHFRRQIDTIEKKLARMRVIREQQRQRRARQGLPLVSLVGYTNSGKSTLLRALTRKKNVLVADKYFATLDTRIGQLFLPSIQKIVLAADTIGFIENLPPVLISSFLATLEEVQKSDLLLHIIDANDPHLERKLHVVNDILEKLHCTEKPQILVLNKIDTMDEKKKNKISAYIEKLMQKRVVSISAEQGSGLDNLKQEIAGHVYRQPQQHTNVFVG